MIILPMNLGTAMSWLFASSHELAMRAIAAGHWLIKISMDINNEAHFESLLIIWFC